MEIQVAIADLKPGMYIVDLEGKSGVDASVFSVEGYVLTENEAPRMLEQGFKTAFVDPARSRLPGTPPLPGQPLNEFDVLEPTRDATPPARTAAYRDEYENAQGLQGEANDIARAVISGVLNDAGLPLGLIRIFLSGIVDSVARNESALLSLGKLKKHEDSIFSHGLNVAILAVALGRQMHVKSDYLHDLALAGFLHDIGKLFVAREVLNFPGKLAPEQLQEVQSHVSRGYDFLKEHQGLPQLVMDGVLDHQERYAGIDYPNLKAGPAISFTGRLLAVADVYDALSSRRSYRSPLTPPQALSIMYGDRLQDYSPGFVETLISALGVYPPGSLVTLSNQYLGVVIESNDAEPLRPKIVLLADGRGARVRPKMTDLDTMRTISIAGPVVRLPANINPEEAIKNAM